MRNISFGYLLATVSSGPSPSPSASIPTCRIGTEPLCCNSAARPSDPAVTFLLELHGIVDDDSAMVGLTCSHSVRACSRQVVCCERDDFNGVVATGCTPHS
ncbi:hypothetical protein B0H10DRAFT_1783501 [Mycena sp. CBHHK59/15]|nr:hypothetical protein B0H10DRAFT_1783501 [Mycena sp. CBHHK59/15]